MRIFSGIAASPGTAIGPAFHFQPVDLCFDRCRVEDTQAEIARLDRALEIARDQLEGVYDRARVECGPEDAAIFQAHALMLEDPELLQTVRRAIEEQGLNAESALSDAAEVYAQMLEALDDQYLCTRAADVRDVADRVLRILTGAAESNASALSHPAIVLARDLAPSDTMLLDKSLVLGFCTAGGGPMAHTAILARSLGLPAVVGAGLEILTIPDGAPSILDGTRGELLLEADEVTTGRYRARQTAADAAARIARRRAKEPAVTRDGHRVEVVANIGNVADAQAALEAGAEGVGLLRTEFLFLERTQLPDEEEQFHAYRTIVDTFNAHQPVILRTLDVGGDKDLPYLDLPQEPNPFLGVRAIRLCLTRPELFRPQLRAALRAAVDRNLKVMFPMVTTVEEVCAARAILEDCRAELVAEGQRLPETMEVGIMIEVPAAALMADRLAAEVDFLSIGTNDLSQYTAAADRTNARVASLVSGFQPAVLRLVRATIDAAHAQGKWVGLCGEFAGHPLAIPILLGLGLDEFSMNPPAIPLAKQVIRTLTLEECRGVAQAALEQESAEAVRALVRERVPAAAVR